MEANDTNMAMEADDARQPTTARRPTRGPWLRVACTEDNPAVHPSIHYPLYAWQLRAPLHLAQAGWPSRPEYGKHMIESTTNS